MNDVRGRVSLAHASHQCTSALWQPFVIIVLPSCPPASSLTATSFEVATVFCRSFNIRCSKPDRSSCVPFPRNVPFWHSRLSASESVQVLTMKGLNLQTTFSKRWDWKKSLLSQQMILSCFRRRVRTVTWELRVHGESTICQQFSCPTIQCTLTIEWEFMSKLLPLLLVDAITSSKNDSVCKK